MSEKCRNVQKKEKSDCDMLSVSGRLMRMVMTGLGLLQLCLLLAIFHAEILPTINIIDVGSLNIYLSPIKMRKALKIAISLIDFL